MPQTTIKTNEQRLASLERSYPPSTWSCSVLEDSDEIVVTFQRFNDDAEDRWIIRNGQATLL